jgi:hypothetical protein
MTPRWRTTIFLLPAVLLTLAASYAEIEILATGITIGDMIGTPPAATEAGKQAIHSLEQRGDRARRLAIYALVPASLLLGFELSRRLEKTFYRLEARALGYFFAFMICPAASVFIVVLTMWIGSSLHPR